MPVLVPGEWDFLSLKAKKVAENGLLGTSKSKLLIWTVALPLQQARQQANAWAECATAIHGWTLRLNGTGQQHQTSCHSLQDITAPGLLYMSAGHWRVEVGMQDQRVCFLCRVITKHLQVGRPMELLYLPWQDVEEKKEKLEENLP